MGMRSISAGGDVFMCTVYLTESVGKKFRATDSINPNMISLVIMLIEKI
jgi:hypothetical protein